MKIRIIIIAIIAVLVAIFVFSNNQEKTVTPEVLPLLAVADINEVVGIARIEPVGGFLNITAGTEGKILDLLAEENDLVSDGQTLAIVSTKVQQIQLKQAQSKLNGQNASIQASKASIQSNEAALKSAQSNAAAIKVNLEKAQQNHSLNEQLFNKKAITRQTLDNSKFDLGKLEKEHQRAIDEIEQNQAILNQSIADLEKTRAQLTEMETDVEYYQTMLNEKSITSPANVKLLEWNVKVGDYVNANTTLGKFAVQGGFVAITEVDEVFAERIRTGQSVVVKSQSTGKAIATGQVSFVADFLKKKSLFTEDGVQEDRRIRTVKVQLNEAKDVLIGSKVDCIIHLN